MNLVSGDTDYSSRRRLLKSRFTHQLAKHLQTARNKKGEDDY